MIYKKLNVEKAKEFKLNNTDYNIYIYNQKFSLLFKMNQGGDVNYFYSFLYLINSDESSIKLSELDKIGNNYKVIFIEPDEQELANIEMLCNN